jgi:hypothetical protein
MGSGLTISIASSRLSLSFEIALPEENVFVDVCGGFPGGIYSPVVTDGHYVSLHPLAVGNYTLHFHV